jgi:hypothetical protein
VGDTKVKFVLVKHKSAVDEEGLVGGLRAEQTKAQLYSVKAKALVCQNIIKVINNE